MGGRGARLGKYYINNKKYNYGEEYSTVVEYGNIKFIKKNEGSANSPLETKTKGRIYALINNDNKIKTISYYDYSGKRFKHIDIIGPSHKVNGKKELPHTHIAYDTHKGDSNDTRVPSKKELELIDRVQKFWDYYDSKK